MSQTEKYSKFYALLIVTLVLFGCKKEEPNPELLDPIYKDLKAEAKKYNSQLKEEEANLEAILEDRENLKPRTIELVANRRDEKKTRGKILQFKQKAKYYEIRSERRRVEARRDYKIAFRKNEAWPNPQEYENYQTYKRLRDAPLNWGYRVPKLYKDSPNFVDKK